MATRSPSLLDPALHTVAHIMNLVLDHTNSHTSMSLARLDEVVDARFCAEMGVRNHRILLLVGPDEVADVVHCDGQDGVGGGQPHGGGDAGAQHDVAVAGDDGASHGGDQHVQGAGEDLLARLLGRRQRAHGAGERVLQAQRRGQRVVDGLLPADGLAVQGHARAADLLGQAVGGRRAVRGLRGEVLGGLRQGGRGGLGNVDGQVVVDGLAVLRRGLVLVLGLGLGLRLRLWASAGGRLVGEASLRTMASAGCSSACTARGAKTAALVMAAAIAGTTARWRCVNGWPADDSMHSPAGAAV